MKLNDIWYIEDPILLGEKDLKPGEFSWFNGIYVEIIESYSRMYKNWYGKYKIIRGYKVKLII